MKVSTNKLDKASQVRNSLFSSYSPDKEPPWKTLEDSENTDLSCWKCMPVELLKNDLFLHPLHRLIFLSQWNKIA